jgi:nitrogen fixation protein NifX
MSLEREMTIVTADALASHVTTVSDAEPTLRLAIATSDLKNVDQHFGTATRLARFEVTAKGSRLAGVCEFTEAEQDGDEDKLVAKLDQLAGQHAVLGTAIGGSAVRRLHARRIQPIKLGEASPIDEVLRYFQREIEVGTTPWINQAIRSRDANPHDRHATWLKEPWQE